MPPFQLRETNACMHTHTPSAVLFVLPKTGFTVVIDGAKIIRTISQIIPHKTDSTWINDSNIKAKLYKMLRNV